MYAFMPGPIRRERTPKPPVDPKVTVGNVTKTYAMGGTPGTTKIVTAGDGTVSPVFIPGTSDKYFIVLNRTAEIQVDRQTFIGINEGDWIVYTEYSWLNKTIEVVP